MRLWSSKSRIGNSFVVGATVLLVLIFTSALLLHYYWPFAEEAVRRQLGDAASADVSFRSFKAKYLPPGCVAEGVVFQRKTSRSPLITIQRLTIRSNFFGLFHHHVSIIRADGMRMNWQKEQNKPRSKFRPTVVDRLIADNAVLEVADGSPKGLRFMFHKFEVRNLRGQGQSSFAMQLDNPLPHGLLYVSGRFGPWNSSAPARTALDGEYTLENADLSVFHAVSGMLSSKGRFGGTFDNLAVQGQTSTPELTVVSTHHGLPLETDFIARVNGAVGDVVLPRVIAQFGKNNLEVHGSIARSPAGRRVASLEIQCDRGRIEDTFYPFIHLPQAAIAGAVRFRMHVTIPSGTDRFEKKIGISSTFDIENARFTHEQTQRNLSKLAQAPRQTQPDTTAPASIRGRVSVEDGVARFSELRIEDQYAWANLHGEFGLLDQRVNLHGQLKTATSLAKTTHGIKAVFARAIEPLFKKKPHETVVPVRIGGTYSRPQFGLGLTGK
jgi:AsmA-like C-terminal region